jgi:hypothetical protein
MAKKIENNENGKSHCGDNNLLFLHIRLLSGKITSLHQGLADYPEWIEVF